jgi:cyclase
MSRSIAARFVAAATLLLPALASAHLADAQIKVHPVAGSVYMLEGLGGNIGVSAGEDGIVIVDDQFAELDGRIRAALRGIADKPVRYVINTNWHSDHVGGNAGFARTGSTLIAHDDVRRRMVSGGAATNLGLVKFDFDPAVPPALPVITFAKELTLHVNGEDIRVLYAGKGHTDGDAIVFFRKSNVVHMGDDYVSGFPFIDLGSGGSAKGLIQTLEAVLPKIPKDAKIIPGHGPLSTPDDVRQFLADVKESVAIVKKALRAGQSLEQMTKGRVLAKFEKRSNPFITTEVFIEGLYNELSGKKLGVSAPPP